MSWPEKARPPKDSEFLRLSPEQGGQWVLKLKAQVEGGALALSAVQPALPLWVSVFLWVRG